MTTEATARRQTQKLQRAIVDGLEDVKAQDLQVFNTEHLSALFERVIIASGNSNRQTKALANSVREAVHEAGFPKPRVEGEANGEWIIVDCGRAVVHVMQPAIRSYYNLEEIWGGTPIRLKLAADRAVAGNSSIKRSEATVKPTPVAIKKEASTGAVPRARRAVPDKTASARPAASRVASGAAKGPAKGSANSSARRTANGAVKGIVKGASKTAVKTGSRGAAKGSDRATTARGGPRQPAGATKRSVRVRRP